MMKAFIPYLRLLTIPTDKLDHFSKFLSNSQKGDLAKLLIFKEDSIPGKVPASLNLSTSPRTRPKTSQLELHFIAEDLIKIKTDFEMMSSELKENT